MKRNGKKILCAVLAAFAVLALPGARVLASYDGAIRQNEAHSAEDSMYRYTLDVSVTNPCEIGNEKKIAALQLRFSYRGENGLGDRGSYVLDMSWDSGKCRNLNDELLKANFVRSDDRAYTTSFFVWVPGIVDEVGVLLNMDGGERLAFEVTGVFLDGCRVNTDSDYVSSAYLDSEAKISCYTPAAAIVGTDAAVPYGTARDQFGGLFTQKNRDLAVQQAGKGVFSLFYHHACG